MTSITIYCSDRAPSARPVVFLATYLKVDAELKYLDLLAREHHQDWYLKINPEHKVPVLVDNDFILTQSRAIMCYLTTKSSAGLLLYPADTKKRALIDCRLNFDATVLGPRSTYFARLIKIKGYTKIDPADKEYIMEGFSYLNDFLKGNEWVSGNQLSVADFACYGTVSIFYYLDNVFDKYPEIRRWYEQFREFDGYQKFLRGAEILAEFINSKLPNGF